MPTCFTAPLLERDVPFAEFALDCATGLDYLYNESGKCPEKLELDPGYLERVQEAAAEYDLVRALTLDGAEVAARYEHEQRLESRGAYRVKTAARLAVYSKMLQQVIAWKPPTIAHSCLKAYMHRQLIESIEHDCRPDTDEDCQQLTGEAWLDQAKADTLQVLQNRQRDYAQAVQRVNKRNAWLALLRVGLGLPSTYTAEELEEFRELLTTESETCPNQNPNSST